MAFEEEDWFNNQYYFHIRRLLVFVGLWPYSKTSKRLPRISFISILMTLVFNVQVYLMLTSELKVERITKLLQTIIPCVIYGTGYWNIIYKSALVKEILRCVRNDWKKLICEDELNIMQKYASQSKVFSQLLACSFLLYIAVLILPSTICFFQFVFGIIDKTKVTLPVYDEVFMLSKLVYYIAFSCELLAIMTSYIMGITNYILFISLLQHACALFVIVTSKLDQPFKENEHKFNWEETGIKQENELNWIVTVIKSYNHAVQFVELITSLYTHIYIVEIMTAVCLVITDFIYVFQILNFTLTAAESLQLFLYVNGTLLMIFAYIHLCERLIEHSISVYAKCQLVPFYKLSVTTNKTFLLLIMRTIKPCNISFGGIVVASHELFAKIIKTSFSFATVFYQVH